MAAAAAAAAANISDDRGEMEIFSFLPICPVSSRDWCRHRRSFLNRETKELVYARDVERAEDKIHEPYDFPLFTLYHVLEGRNNKASTTGLVTATTAKCARKRGVT
ncbi:hypothetical protein OUZ56_004599 [Daphnia magna]|uniref:Uncharacterized protein n=1 Tax=Daphnia magna TaxID=35525 RepID=A0ABQ9YQ95_9CRUS|nr:hypothetical protein OUZ56_004599 [Daphnia magna]